MEIFRTFNFDAAHRLTHLADGHKCGNLHGHTFTVEVHLSGDVDAESGWLMDFSEVQARGKTVIDELDHHYLNDIPGLENPTCENICRWLWDHLKPVLPPLSKVVVRESPQSGAVYMGK